MKDSKYVNSTSGSPIPNGLNVFAGTYFSRQRGEVSVFLKKRGTSAKLFISFEDAENLRDQLAELIGR